MYILYMYIDVSVICRFLDEVTESTLNLLMTEPHESMTSSCQLLTPLHCISIIDPRASWFGKWMVRVFIIQLLHTVARSMVFCTPEEVMAMEVKGVICPSRMYKTHGPPPQHAKNCFVIHVPWYNGYSSSRSSVVIFKHYYD